MIEIEVDDAQVLYELQRLADSVLDSEPVLMLIGEKLVESTKARFANKTAPDGSQWERNSDTTINLEWKRRDGSIRPAKARDDPLVGEGTLGETINYKINGDELLIGSNMEYAAMMQFGGTKAEFPHLLGDIPARPFLGISNDDRDEILVVLSDYLGF